MIHILLYFTISESHGPDLHIKLETTGEMSKNQVLEVATTQGHSMLNFLCFSNSIRPTILSWSHEGANTLPSGVKVHYNTMRNKPSSSLVWKRSALHNDSGRYICTASNKNGINTGRLELLVRREYSRQRGCLESNHVYSLGFFAQKA